MTRPGQEADFPGDNVGTRIALKRRTLEASGDQFSPSTTYRRASENMRRRLLSLPPGHLSSQKPILFELKINPTIWAPRLRRAKEFFGFLTVVVGVGFFVLAIDALSISNPTLKVTFVIGDISLALALLVSGVTAAVDAITDTYNDEKRTNDQARFEGLLANLAKELGALKSQNAETELKISEGLATMRDQAGKLASTDELKNGFGKLQGGLKALESELNEFKRQHHRRGSRVNH